jgi:hypothetical protein
MLSMLYVKSKREDRSRVTGARGWPGGPTGAGPGTDADDQNASTREAPPVAIDVAEDALMRRRRFFGQRDKLRADRSKEA